MSDVQRTQAEMQVANVSNIGTISYADDVIAIIAGIAAMEIEGVAGMTGNLAEGISELLGRKNLSKGVKVDVGNEEAAIDLYMVLDYGVSLIEVSKKAQENVKKNVEGMTGLKVVEVNIHVQGINIEKPAKPPKPVKEEVPPRVR